MFGNKKKSTTSLPEDVTLEIKTMESDLEKEKPEKKNFSFKGGPSPEPKTASPLEIKRKPSQSPFLREIQKKPTVLSRKFLPDSERDENDTGNLIPQEQKPKKRVEVVTRKKTLYQPEKIVFTKKNNPASQEQRIEEAPISKKSPFPKIEEKKNNLPEKPFKPPIKKESVPESDKVSGNLIFALVIVLAITVFSGAYYYFFVYNDIQDLETEQPTDDTSMEIVAPEEHSAELIEAIPTPLEEADLLEIKEQDLLKTLSVLPSNEPDLTDGKFYTILDNGQTLNATSVFDSLNIDLPENIDKHLDKGWIFVKKTPGQNLRIGLVVKINNSVSTLETELLSNEKTFPALFDSLYIEDQLPLLENQTVRFSESTLGENFRYYNFYPDKTQPSFDWGIKQYQNQEGAGSFLIFSTSMETTQTINQLTQ